METQHPRVVELGRGRSITYPPLGTKLGSRVPFLIRVLELVTRCRVRSTY